MRVVSKDGVIPTDDSLKHRVVAASHVDVGTKMNTRKNVAVKKKTLMRNHHVVAILGDQ